MTYERHKMFDDVAEALNDQGLTVGAKVECPYIVAGNLSSDDPALSPLLIDDLGRIWKERHQGGAHELVCVLDLRAFGPNDAFGAQFARIKELGTLQCAVQRKLDALGIEVAAPHID